tara:strand:+ start:98 stop:514 length:417 start_codon:yes stop_codon:yes gene_type:complete
MKEWHQVKNIEMLVNSIDLTFSIGNPKIKIFLYCDLLNIARGRCTLILENKTNNSSEINSQLLIKEDKAIMNAIKTLDEKEFIEIKNQLQLMRFNKSKKIRVNLSTNKPLAVDSSGFLQVEEDIKLKIISIKFKLPYL